jgi:replication factor A1
VLRSSTVTIDPDLPEAKRLQDWYQNEVNREQILNISRSSSLSTISKSMTHSNLICLDKLKDALLDGIDEFITTTATIINVGKKYSIYMACPQSFCYKKVIQRNNGMFKCENCDQIYDHFKWRIVLKVSFY